MNKDSLYKHNSLFNRRDFLRLTGVGCGAMTLSSAANTILHQKLLGAMASNAVISGPDDYKALICIFLYGGNDGHNCFMPFSNYEELYNGTNGRNEVFIPGEQLNVTQSGDFAFHPELPYFRDAFDQGIMAPVSGVGTLYEPVADRNAFIDNGIIKPPQLFSHNDQQVQWQTSLPGQESDSGWGGRLGDVAQVFNTEARVSINVSLGRANVFTVGDRSTRLELNGGAVSLQTSGPNGLLDAAQEIRNLDKPHTFRKEFADIMSRGVESEALLGGILGNNNNGGAGSSLLDGNAGGRPSDILHQQLANALRLIEARDILGVKRQIFFVEHINFDTHGSQIAGHATQLEILNNAMSLLASELEALGLTDKVTTFTATEFGRSFLSNMDGTDHGWGNINFVFGGAVNGGEIHGTLPSYELGGMDDASNPNDSNPMESGSNGRWIPSLSTDQYASTFARWFGVPDEDISTIVPNINRFDSNDIGFMCL